jgi:hypothetical protein
MALLTRLSQIVGEEGKFQTNVVYIQVQLLSSQHEDDDP